MLTGSAIATSLSSRRLLLVLLYSARSGAAETVIQALLIGYVVAATSVGTRTVCE